MSTDDNKEKKDEIVKAYILALQKNSSSLVRRGIKDIDVFIANPQLSVLSRNIVKNAQLELFAFTSLPTTKINPIDGAKMVLIPAGEFLMGTNEEERLRLIKYHTTYQPLPDSFVNKCDWFSHELPQHKVFIDAFYIYETEVTVAQYRKFCKMTNHKMPQQPHWRWKNSHPIVNVTWDDANDYAEWAGVRLPTEAQWEKAARGTDSRVFPWGNDWDYDMCNHLGSSETTPVSMFPMGKSSYGVMDMSGNVSEWCADWYDKDYYKYENANNPKGPEIGISRVTRGGSFRVDFIHDRCASRLYEDPDCCCYYYGFRCASPVP